MACTRKDDVTRIRDVFTPTATEIEYYRYSLRTRYAFELSRKMRRDATIPRWNGRTVVLPVALSSKNALRLHISTVANSRLKFGVRDTRFIMRDTFFARAEKLDAT